MDDTAMHEEGIVQKATRAVGILQNKYVPLLPELTLDMNEPTEERFVCPDTTKVPCLLQTNNIKGRYIALKSANERDVVAAGFTYGLAYRRAKRKGFDSCIVISNRKDENIIF